MTLIQRLLFVAILTCPLVFAQQASAAVRFAQFIPNWLLLEVVSESNLVFDPQKFWAVTAYAEMPVGALGLKLRISAEQPVVLASLIAQLQAGKRYTLIALGTAEKPLLRWLEDPNEPDLRQAKIRIIHAAPDVAAIDLAYKEGPVLLRNAAFSQASNYRPMPASRYYLELRPTGSRDVIFPIEEATFEQGKLYSIFMVGLNESKSLEVVIIEDTFSP